MTWGCRVAAYQDMELVRPPLSVAHRHVSQATQDRRHLGHAIGGGGHHDVNNGIAGGSVSVSDAAVQSHSNAYQNNTPPSGGGGGGGPMYASYVSSVKYESVDSIGSSNDSIIGGHEYAAGGGSGGGNHYSQPSPAAPFYDNEYYDASPSTHFFEAGGMGQHQLGTVSMSPNQTKQQSDKRQPRTGRLNNMDRKRPYPCRMCPSKFGSKMELEEHQNSHTGQKPFECEVCKSRFNRRSTLWNHKRIHSDAKPFVCTVCNMQFKWKNSLKCHKEMHVRKNETTVAVDNDIRQLTYATAAKKRRVEIDGSVSPASIISQPVFSAASTSSDSTAAVRGSPKSKKKCRTIKPEPMSPILPSPSAPNVTASLFEPPSDLNFVHNHLLVSAICGDVDNGLGDLGSVSNTSSSTLNQDLLDIKDSLLHSPISSSSSNPLNVTFPLLKPIINVDLNHLNSCLTSDGTFPSLSTSVRSGGHHSLPGISHFSSPSAYGGQDYMQHEPQNAGHFCPTPTRNARNTSHSSHHLNSGYSSALDSGLMQNGGGVNEYLSSFGGYMSENGCYGDTDVAQTDHLHMDPHLHSPGVQMTGYEHHPGCLNGHVTSGHLQ